MSDGSEDIHVELLKLMLLIVGKASGNIATKYLILLWVLFK